MKPVWEAYRVGRLGRGGFAEIAAEAQVPNRFLLPSSGPKKSIRL